MRRFSLNYNVVNDAVYPCRIEILEQRPQMRTIQVGGYLPRQYSTDPAFVPVYLPFPYIQFYLTIPLYDTTMRTDVGVTFTAEPATPNSNFYELPLPNLYDHHRKMCISERLDDRGFLTGNRRFQDVKEAVWFFWNSRFKYDESARNYGCNPSFISRWKGYKLDNVGPYLEKDSVQSYGFRGAWQNPGLKNEV